MEQSKLIISEILFVIQNKFGTIPLNNLQNVVSSFFSDDEISKGKRTLHEIAMDLYGIKEIGRCITRSGENKRRMNTADLVDLYSMLDRKKAPLPSFVAASMNRIPGVRPLESDVVALSASLADLKQQVLFLQTAVGKCQINAAVITAPSVGVQGATADLNVYPELLGKPLVVSLDTCKIEASSSKPEPTTTLPSISGCSEALTDADEWTLVKRKNKALKSADAPSPLFSMKSSDTTPPASSSLSLVCAASRDIHVTSTSLDTSPPVSSTSPLVCAASRDVVTSKSSDTSPPTSSSSSLVCASRDTHVTRLKAACETRTWHCKISNLHKDATVNIVKEHLQEFSIDAIAVEILQSKSSTSVSMHVVVPFDVKETVMCNNFWPKGIRVSGWRLYRESKQQVRRQHTHYQRDWEYDY